MGAGKKFGVGIRLVIMAGCYFLAVRYNADVQDAARIAVVSLADGGVSVEMAESICGEEQATGQVQESRQDQESRQAQESGQNQAMEKEQAPGEDRGQWQTLSLCFWREQENLQFSCKETGQTAQAPGLLTEGNPELAARDSEILAWQKSGCVMDAATAQELFGTQQANGQLVWCGGEAYTVYGTFNSLERIVVLRAGAGSMGGIGYDHLSLRASGGANVKTEAEQLLMRRGLSGEIADFTFPGMVCGNLLLVLPVLLAVELARILWGCLWEEKSVGCKITVAALLAVTGAALFFLLRDHLQIPADMIPTRWSDFSFWTQWWTGQKANLLQILSSAQGEMQLEALWSCGLSVLCNIFAIFVS